MSNRIHRITVRAARLDPARAEVVVSVFPERLTPATELRGRLVGPRCPYATTVEVAYPLREQARGDDPEDGPRLVLRAVIPEPSLWDAEAPFLYEGPLELWQDGVLCAQAALRHGLRSFHLGPRGLRWNGRQTALRGVARDRCDRAEATRLRAAGYNVLLAPAEAAGALADVADRFGFFLLVRAVGGKADFLGDPLLERPSFLGWVLSPDRRDAAAGAPRGPGVPLLGVELDEPPAGPPPSGIGFVFCEEAALAALEGVPLPKLVARASSSHGADSPGVMGWIEMG